MSYTPTLHLDPWTFSAYSDHTVDLSTARQRVHVGAALLDRKRPGWRELIAIDCLDLLDHSNCILGQLYGNYLHGLHELRLCRGTGHGFAFEYEDLEAFTYAWMEELCDSTKE